MKKTPNKPDKSPKKGSGKKGGKRPIKEWIKAVLIALLIFLFFKIFMGQSITVQSSRMEKTIYNGDHIFINKLALGARMPITLLSFPFTDNTMPFSSIPSFLDWIQLPCMRIPGYSSIKRNDLLVFNYPYENDVPIDMKTAYVKRCMGLPGDSMRIYDKKVFLNNKELPVDSACIQYRYRVVTKKGTAPLKTFWEKFEIYEGGFVTNQVYDFIISLKNAALLEKDSLITDVRTLKLDNEQASKIYFPNDLEYRWNLDYFGPIRVPEKNDTIKLTKNNIAVYKRIIETYEKNKLVIEGNRIMINDVESFQYVFKQNYYFVLDDNRDDAKDSRYWGFLPEDHIIGKASFVWFSFAANKSGFNKVRWSRIFKGL
jgi:signal peptidase I